MHIGTLCTLHENNGLVLQSVFDLIQRNFLAKHNMGQALHLLIHRSIFSTVKKDICLWVVFVRSCCHHWSDFLPSSFLFLTAIIILFHHYFINPEQYQWGKDSIRYASSDSKNGPNVQESWFTCRSNVLRRGHDGVKRYAQIARTFGAIKLIQLSVYLSIIMRT